MWAIAALWTCWKSKLLATFIRALANTENDSVLLRQLRTEVIKLDGHMTVIKAPNHVRIKEDFLTTVDENIKVLSLKIKESFDPKKILNPGKMYSGI